MNFDLIPAIDLKDGQCVRLKQGRMEDATVYHKDPVIAAKKWLDAGTERLHIVDLDGAFAGKPVNLEVIEQICQTCPNLDIQIGGGIRQLKTIDDYLSAGVKYCILGTSAVKDPNLVMQACAKYPQQIILGVDAKNGWVAVEGWDEASTIKVSDLINNFAEQAIAAVIYTDIARDGMLQGVNLESTIELAENSPFPIIASGGVKNLNDIEWLLKAHKNIQGVIAGRALYSGDLLLEDALATIKKNHLIFSMSYTYRIIPCLDVDNGRVVKGTNFIGLKDAGDPIEIASRYNQEGADELTFLDISASHQGRETTAKMVQEVAKRLFIPLTVGGGIREITDIEKMLLCGADKVSINTAAITNPELVKNASNHFGNQCIVVAIDAKQTSAHQWEIFTHGGRKATNIDAIEWAKKMTDYGAGEIFIDFHG